MVAVTTAVTMGSAAPAGPGRLVARIGACQGCGACLLTCPTHAIRPRGGTLIVRDEICTGCGECVEVCPVDAIDLATDLGSAGQAAAPW